jgi:3D (Asp-Asp-Asp) domain-containing protein/Icc-related predicted phosphoesterase
MLPIVEVVRVAAVGDLHYSRQQQGALHQTLVSIGTVADVLVICGDLTDYGLPDEARALGRELTHALKIPIVAVLGNHDHESGHADDVRELLRESGIIVLDGDSCEVHGIGFAGVKGFCGGFGKRALGSWGEPVIKQFVQEAVGESLKLETALARLRTSVRLAVLHYAPICETVVQSLKSSSNNPSTSSANSDSNNQLAMVSDKASDKALGKATGDAKNEVTAESAVTEPKVSLKNPALKFEIKPDESKMDGREFADPDLEILGEPQTFQATAYALQGRTRVGTYVRRGVIAADPQVIPLGSIVQIKTPGYTGVYVVHDTGRKIKGNVVDVWVPSSREARVFGRRRIKLHVLRHGPTGSRNQ